MLSIPHLIIIFLVALVVLGPEKLPQVARVLGKTMADFRRITTDFRMQVEDEMRELERQTREREIATAALSATAVLPRCDLREYRLLRPNCDRTNTEATEPDGAAARKPRPQRNPPMVSPIPPEIVPSLQPQEEGGKMSFFEHLGELRKRIIHSAAAILLGAFVGFAVAKPVLAFIARPMVKALTRRAPRRQAHLHASCRLLESGDPDGPVSGHRPGLAVRAVPGLAVRRARAVQARKKGPGGIYRSRRGTVFWRHRVCLLRDPAVPDEIPGKFPGARSVSRR